MTIAAAAMVTTRPPSCGRGPCDELPPPDPVPLPPPRPPSFCSVCGRYHLNQVALDRDRLCFHFPQSCRRFAASPRVAVLSVITGLIPRHVCAPYLLCGDPCCLSTPEDMTPRFRRYAVRSGNRSTPVLVYRGDASQRSAYELADLRCRPPPSTLFYCLKLIKRLLRRPSCGGRRNVCCATSPERRSVKA